MGEHRHPEELPLAELVDDVAIVEKLDRTSADDEEMRRGITGLSQDVGSVGERLNLEMFCAIIQLFGVQVLEGRELDQEPSNILDLRRVV